LFVPRQRQYPLGLSMRVFLLAIGLLLAGLCAAAQDTLRGFVFEETESGRLQPLVAANVVWLGTTLGTTSDGKGYFVVPAHPKTRQLQISYIGKKPDTLQIERFSEVKVILKSQSKLQTVEIAADRAATYVSSLNPIKTQVMTEQELFKAACCNLSESFETNPAVDVSYTDAVSGVKQLQLLGLSGTYIQMQRENLPDVRALSANYGLTFIPGSWIDNIQLTRGIGSVVNGFESISGQMNVELKKTDSGDSVFVNGYQNQMGRSEINWYSRHQLSPSLSTAVLLHGNRQGMMNDVNKDGFLDIPAGNQINIHNRWKYDNGQGWIVQGGWALVRDRRLGGQSSFDKNTDRQQQMAYGTGFSVDRFEVYGKVGYVFPQQRYRSVGYVTQYVNHRTDAFFGRSDYLGKQGSLYQNLIFQDILGNTNHKYRTGVSLITESYGETYKQFLFNRREVVPGAFYEYTYTGLRLQLIGGVRIDHHNLYGWLFTPRLHAKYDITDQTALRLAAGRGYRVANVFAENMGGLISSRQVAIMGNGRGAYGLEMEKAWNFGLSLTQGFKFRYRDASLNVDLHHTRFDQQVVVDYDYSPTQLLFYNLQGASYSTSFQTEVDLKPARRFDVRLAYRWLDVKTQYQTGFFTRPLVARHRVFMNLAYETRSKWMFDYTVSRIGTKRLPITAGNPEGLRFPEQSPAYWIMNGQVTKRFKRWDVYLGVENLADFRQTQLINAADQPFSPFFDASMIWGPAIERMVYVGFRFRIPNSTE